ncbi:DUF4097 family beta strand repeat-containing protein [Phosphitispora sp. TUW77]|uniref:DUF4097 family beta strand repeat-containing protein n=1 Tax=Phosphitispora sp. TUW77 TaxID=3152361 RepID=UPI003AB4DBDD
MNKKRKAGPVTLALGLISFGFILLISNFSGIGIFGNVLKYWPLLLIGLGIEYFIRSYFNSKKEEGETGFHIPSLVIVLLIALCGYAGQQVAGILQNYDLNDEIAEAVSGTKYSYKYEYKSNSISAAPGTKILIDDLGGQVNMVPGAGDKISVEAEITGWGPSREEAERRAKQFSINISEGNVISVSKWPESSCDFKRPLLVKYRIVIPAKVDVVIDTESCELRADDLEADMEINTEHGDLSIVGITGDIFVNSGYGRINVKDIIGNLNVRNDSGDINVNNISGDIKLNMKDGNIEMSGTNPITAKYYVTNRYGSTIVRIPEKSDVSVRAESLHGSISGSLNLDIEHSGADQNQGARGTAVLGEGKGIISITSDDGVITIDNS